MTRTVLMNAGPWLPVPPGGYGGIENVVAALVPELRRLGIRVLLATVAQSDLPADEHLTRFRGGQFAELQRPYNQVSGVAHAHLHAVVRALRDRDDIDVVHDHVEVVGLAVLAAAALAPEVPPVLHTLHWDLGKHADFYSGLDAGPRVRVNGVSASQLDRAPEALRRHSVGHVHLATPLAVGADRRPRAEKGGHAVVMGRITPGKGQHLAARLAHECGFDLVLAGPVGPYRQPADLTAAGGTAAANPDVRYWEDEVRPLVDGIRVRWIGTVAGERRNSLVASARVALFPLQWEEPGGTAVVEALALGTPAVGLSRGCLPELVEHGRTGWLAKSPDDLAALVQESGKIDPHECCEQAARRFTPAVMAARYADLYEQLISGSIPRAAGKPLPIQLKAARFTTLPDAYDRPVDTGESRPLAGGAVLRQARPGDEDGILECVRGLAEYEKDPGAVQATAEDLSQVLFGAGPSVSAHVIEKDGEIVAIAVWFLNFSAFTGRHGIYLEDLFVREDERRHGYGRALIKALAEVCVQRGYRRFEWAVLDWNEPSIRFYRSIGAVGMDEWKVQRLSGDALTRLATS